MSKATEILGICDEKSTLDNLRNIKMKLTSQSIARDETKQAYIRVVDGLIKSEKDPKRKKQMTDLKSKLDDIEEKIYDYTASLNDKYAEIASDLEDLIKGFDSE